jgi:hypothetical protein
MRRHFLAAGPARVGVLGASALTFLGLLKMNVSGPGICQVVKGMWDLPAAEQQKQ